MVQVGASAAFWFRRRFPRWLTDLCDADLLAVAAGAGLAGGFNTPLLGVVFVAEEFLGRFSTGLIWPALVISALAAAFSSLVGQPEFALGMLGVAPDEITQLLWAVPLGLVAGALGAVFAWLLLTTTRRWRHLSTRRPLTLGLLMTHMIEGGSPTSWLLPGALGNVVTLLVRLIAPVLALGSGIPGGLIDPSFAFGAVLGHGIGDLAMAPQLGLSLGMVAGLAGATQLPVMAVLFGMRLAGDQQLLPGLLLASVIGAFVSRLLVDKPVYHALKDIADEP